MPWNSPMSPPGMNFDPNAGGNLFGMDSPMSPMMGSMMGSPQQGGYDPNGGAYANAAANQQGSMLDYLARIYGSNTQGNIANIQGGTARDVAGIQGNTAQNVAKTGLEGQKYGWDAQSGMNTANNATQRYGMDQNALSNRFATQGGMYGADVGRDIAAGNNATQRYGDDTQRYGADVGREVAGINAGSNIQQASIGASASALPAILKDAQRHQMMSSPLMQSLLGSNSLGGALGGLGGLGGGGLNSGGGQPGAHFDASTPYDAKGSVSSLMGQITHPNTPPPISAQFNPGASSAPPPPTAVQPQAPQMPMAPGQPPPQARPQLPPQPAPTAPRFNNRFG